MMESAACQSGGHQYCTGREYHGYRCWCRCHEPATHAHQSD